MAIDLASVEGMMGIAASAVGLMATVYKTVIKKHLDKRREEREASRNEFFTALRTMREENTAQHAEGRQWLMDSEARTNETLIRMESKQDHLVVKVDKIEDDVANVRERTAYLEGTVGASV